jgi:hypothetical protein
MTVSFLDNFDDDDSDLDREAASRSPRCKACGSTDVRWRQQGGRWVLFSLQPGVEHRCDPDAFSDDFEVT